MDYIVMAGCEYPARPTFSSLNFISSNESEAKAEAARRNAVEARNGNLGVTWFVVPWPKG